MARGDQANTSPKSNEKDADEERNDNDEQSARFIETARRLGVDETSEKFERLIGKVLREKTPEKR